MSFPDSLITHTNVVCEGVIVSAGSPELPAKPPPSPLPPRIGIPANPPPWAALSLQRRVTLAALTGLACAQSGQQSPSGAIPGQPPLPRPPGRFALLFFFSCRLVPATLPYLRLESMMPKDSLFGVRICPRVSLHMLFENRIPQLT